jgi:hypothetical protein
MRNIIILTLAFLSLMLYNCSTISNIKNNEIDIMYGDSMMYELKIEKATSYQIDSLILADTLPPLNLWLTTSFLDFETNKRILKRMCIKTQVGNKESVYTILGIEEPFKIEKRIRK